MPVSRLDRIYRERAARRRRTALARALTAVEALQREGIEAVVFGSLADGSFKQHSDVDFLITRHDDRRPTDIHRIIGSAMDDLPFDVVFADQVGEADRALFLRSVLDVGSLRDLCADPEPVGEGLR